MIVICGVFGVFLAFSGVLMWRARLAAERVAPVVSDLAPSASSTAVLAPRAEYSVEGGRLYDGDGKLLLSSVRQAGFVPTECGDDGLRFYALIEGRVFFVESCSVDQIGGPLWMYDPSTLRFTRRTLVPGILSVATSPDRRYDLSLVDLRGELESRQLLVRDLLRDTETRVASLPKKWSYSAAVSEFIGAPIGSGRWEDGKFVVSVYDVSTRLPYAGEEGDIRPVLFEKTITLP